MMMPLLAASARRLAIAALLVVLGRASGAAVDDDALTYGSAVKLQHSESKYFLHSHQINWGSGSGQQSVTCHGGADDQGGLWIITEAHERPFHEVAQPVPCGAIVRLTHVETGKNLHSHLFSSPLSNQQEVSCFGDRGRGDTGDNWEVVCTARGATHWKREQEVRLKHKDTGKLLQSQTQHAFTQRNCPSCPIVGQLEVSCGGKEGPTTMWKAVQGIFFKPKHEEVDDEL